MKEPSSGIIHIQGELCGGEYTLCGLAFDEPTSERGEPEMVYCNEIPNCEKCIQAAKNLLPRIKKLLKKIDKKS